MNYIAVDTSGKNLTLIVKNNGKIYEFYDKDCGVHHSERLMVELEKLLESADMKLSDADFFACVVGAGSFTGIRIGVATVKALAFANKKPVLKITSFDTIAYNIDSGKVLAILDAKHGGYYICAYVDGACGAPEFASKDRIDEYTSRGYRLLSGEEIDGIPTFTVSVKDGFVAAIDKKVNGINCDVNSLTPLYVRKSQAEEGR